MEKVIHDLKTERQNVSAGLPSTYRLVPIAFYLVASASLLLTLYFYLSKKAYEAAEAEMTLRLSQAKSEQATHFSSRDVIVAESQKAEGIASWLEGCRPLQPVAAVIGRSMGKDSTVAELSLARNPEIPAHTFLQLKVDGGGSEQVENTLALINSLDYQTYSAQQVKGRNSTDFQATLIHSKK